VSKAQPSKPIPQASLAHRLFDAVRLRPVHICLKDLRSLRASIGIALANIIHKLRNLIGL
ncbi:MAG: hypothetical protein P8P65_15915, partial [Planktotalea sp.]